MCAYGPGTGVGVKRRLWSLAWKEKRLIVIRFDPYVDTRSSDLQGEEVGYVIIKTCILLWGQGRGQQGRVKSAKLMGKWPRFKSGLNHLILSVSGQVT